VRCDDDCGRVMWLRVSVGAGVGERVAEGNGGRTLGPVPYGWGGNTCSDTARCTHRAFLLFHTASTSSAGSFTTVTGTGTLVRWHCRTTRYLRAAGRTRRVSTHNEGCDRARRSDAPVNGGVQRGEKVVVPRHLGTITDTDTNTDTHRNRHTDTPTHRHRGQTHSTATPSQHGGQPG
jgi:hypothetical protein